MGNKSSGRLRAKLDQEMEGNQTTIENGLQEEGILVDVPQPQLVIAGVNQQQQKNPRRIVKATPPKKSELGSFATTGTDSVSLQDYDQIQPQDVAEYDDGFEKVNYAISTSITSLTEAASRELAQEKADIILSDIKQSAHERHKVKRETEVNNRRLQKTTELTPPTADASGTVQCDVESEQRAQQLNHPSHNANLKPNPMSKFLPAFSVEQHPEHKRSYPKQQTKQNNAGHISHEEARLSTDGPQENTSEIFEPYGKKRKPSLPSDSESSKNQNVDSSHNDGQAKDYPDDSRDDSNNWWIRFLLLVSSGALIAFGIAISSRWKQRKFVT